MTASTGHHPNVAERRGDVRYAATADGSVAYRVISGDEHGTQDVVSREARKNLARELSACLAPLEVVR
jgi:hypothetical protein